MFQLAQDGTQSGGSWRLWQPLARFHSRSTAPGPLTVGSVRRWLEGMVGSGISRVMACVGARCVGMWPLQVLVSALMVPAGGGGGGRGGTRGSRSRGPRSNAPYGRHNAPPPQPPTQLCPVRFSHSPNEVKLFLSKLSELVPIARHVPNDRFEGMMTEGVSSACSCHCFAIL